MKKPIELTRQMFDSRLDYNPETGVLTWLNDRPIEKGETVSRYKNWKKRMAGREAGTTNVEGYRQFAVNGTTYRTHRAAVAFMMGCCPANIEVDHIDGDRSNNRWSNLRLVDRSENSRNMAMSSRNNTGIVGVSFDKRRNRYQAYGCKKYLGSYRSIEDAAIARQKWLDKQNGYTDRHGSPGLYSIEPASSK